MFTGLVQMIGTLERAGAVSGRQVTRICCKPWDEEMMPGESVAVNGVCLTVEKHGNGWFECETLTETLRTTNLGALRSGSRVNLERAVRMGDRLGGHLLTGHVDGIGVVKLMGRHQDGDIVLRIGYDAKLAHEIARKGSIACDGVSLTVASVSESENFFETRVVSYTRDNTTLGELAYGSTVNLETDIIAKYVNRRMGLLGGGNASGVSLDCLEASGFI